MQLMPTWGAGEEVQRSAELTRILALPRRRWSEADLRSIHAGVDPLVRKLGGTMSLFLAQAQALFELMHGWGVFVPLSVGIGKTIIGLLAPLFAKASRPMLIVPAALTGEKARKDFDKYSEHFHVPNYIKIESYETLGRVKSKNLLNDYKPDLLICDEGHRLKNKGAGCTKVVLWYMHDHLNTKFVLLSGTITTKSILEYAHLLQLALRQNSPLPIHTKELQQWARHLDKREVRIGAGALLDMCNDEEIRGPEPARHAYQRRLRDTNGVISSDFNENEFHGSLFVDFERVEIPVKLQEELAKMRKDYVTPNGEAFESDLEMYRHVRSMALGYFDHWDPIAPVPWLKKRKEWAAASRKILRFNQRRLTTHLDVIKAVDRGLYPEAEEALAEWREVSDTYKPKNVPAWLSFFLLDHIKKYIAHAPPTLVWVNQIPFGVALAEATGMPYYGQGGIDARTKKSIEVDPGGRSIICSVGANATGRNLQDRWSHNLLVNPGSQGKQIEQLIGRTHRGGQPEDEVWCRVIVTCLEHEFALQNAIAEARYLKETLGQDSKLLIADFLQPFTYATL